MKRRLCQNPPRHRPSPFGRQQAYSCPTKRSSCHWSSTLSSESLTSSWRPTSRICQGIDLGYTGFTDASHTLTAREHEEGDLAFQIACVWYSYWVIPLGLASSPLEWARVSAVLSRAGQSMFQLEELRVRTCVDDGGPPLHQRVVS